MRFLRVPRRASDTAVRDKLRGQTKCDETVLSPARNVGSIASRNSSPRAPVSDESSLSLGFAAGCPHGLRDPRAVVAEAEELDRVVVERRGDPASDAGPVRLRAARL